MKLTEHKISKFFKELDPKKYKAVAGEKSGLMKLACYAVMAMQKHNIVATYENICAVLWTLFPKVDKFHLYGFDDIPDIDLMEKIIKLRSWHDYKVFGGGNNMNKSSNEPWYLTERGELWAREAEAILTGKIISSSSETERKQGTFDDHTGFLENIANSELYGIFREEPERTKIRKSVVATALGMYFMDKTFENDFKQKKKEILVKLKERQNAQKSSSLDDDIKEFLQWIEREIS